MSEPVYQITNVSSEFRKAVADLYRYRALLFQLIRRDITVRYRQSLFGYFWAVAPQLLTVVIFSMLSTRRIVNIGPTEMPYLLHALWGMSMWQYFSACLMQSTCSLAQAENLIRKINFPKEVLVFASVGQPLVDFGIRLLPFVLFCMVHGFSPAPASFLILPIMILMTLLTLSFGLILSVFNLAMRDVSNALSLVLMAGVFLAPVLYPEPSRYPGNLVNWLNPFSPFLIASRQLMLGHEISNILPLTIVAGGSVVMFIFCWIVFRFVINRIAERA